MNYLFDVGFGKNHLFFGGYDVFYFNMSSHHVLRVSNINANTFEHEDGHATDYLRLQKSCDQTAPILFSCACDVSSNPKNNIRTPKNINDSFHNQ